MSWEDAARRVDELAHGFLALGVRKGDAFAILGNTRLEWALANFALAQIGVAVIPVYPTSSPADCAYVLAHSEAVGIVCEDEEMLARIQGIRGARAFEHILSFADLDELARRGREHAAANPGAVERSPRRSPRTTCSRSSTRPGRPAPRRAASCSTRTTTSVVDALLGDPRIIIEGDVVLLFLPLAHNFAQLVL